MARILVLPLLLLASPAAAQEVYLGGSAHAVELPTSLDTDEGGADIQFGYRTAPLDAFERVGKPSAYIHGQVSVNGDTSLIAAGLSWNIKATDNLYVRPGIGLAVHNDKLNDVRVVDGQRVQYDLGSRILFEPELAIGYRLDDRWAVEASWVHVSHATILDEQNPGMDFIGARVVMKLD